MKKNEELQKDVQDAIRWEPLLHAAEIGVTAKDGIITLTGSVDSYRKKLEAEEAAKNVSGVKGVAEEITVNLGSASSSNDTDIAADVVNTFKGDSEVPDDHLSVEVEQGWVTLSGKVKWNYQREAAEKAATNLAGVKGISNYIEIRSDHGDDIEKKDIEKAIKRNSSLKDCKIKVQVSGNHVNLHGHVSTFYQKDEAGRMAWNASGVTMVGNDLLVEH